MLAGWSVAVVLVSLSVTQQKNTSMIKGSVIGPSGVPALPLGIAGKSDQC
jgi:hypothetical protein